MLIEMYQKMTKEIIVGVGIAINVGIILTYFYKNLART
jgi:hypothetical protein